ncbi:hypothetical protein H1C71_011375 [Ictidomys tridecemlineatus]|nr:hypothetical protein H1C71_011375 [Ictidomys tridecemlineatus]
MDWPDESQWDETTCNMAICLPDKRLISSAKRSSKLPVLNLNETKLPCPQGVRNMVVIWIPEPEKNVSLAKKTHTFPSQDEKEERKNLLSDGGKTVPCPETKIQLAMMKKKLPLEKNRPESALSSKMFLTIHRLTLQTPTLRYSEHLKKLHCNLQGEGPEISEAEATYKDVSAPEEAVLEGPVASGQNISGQMTGESWNPELKLPRTLQPTDDENEKNQPSGAQSWKSLQTEVEGIT